MESFKNSNTDRNLSSKGDTELNAKIALCKLFFNYFAAIAIVSVIGGSAICINCILSQQREISYLRSQKKTALSFISTTNKQTARFQKLYIKERQRHYYILKK